MRQKAGITRRLKTRLGYSWLIEFYTESIIMRQGPLLRGVEPQIQGIEKTGMNYMKTKIIICIAIISITGITEAKTPKQCKLIEKKIETINKTLKRGYREPTGNKLRAKRKKLEEELFMCFRKH